MTPTERQSAAEAAKRQIALRDAATPGEWEVGGGHSLDGDVAVWEKGARGDGKRRIACWIMKRDTADFIAAARGDKSPEAVIALAEECEKLMTNRVEVAEILRAAHLARNRNPEGATVVDFMHVWNEQKDERIKEMTAKCERLEQIVHSVVRNCQHVSDARHRSEPGPLRGPTWAKVAHLCGMGSTRATQLCIEHGVDPYYDCEGTTP